MLLTSGHSVRPYEGLRIEGDGSLRVVKMRIIERDGVKSVRFSEGITVAGIPAEAWKYQVNGKSALEWVIERYSDSCDKASGLRNDCNDWGR